MLLPGASRSRNDADCEKPTTASALVVAPTLTALEMQAGAPTPDRNVVAPPGRVTWAALPAEATVAIWNDRRLSMMSL